MTLQKQTRIKNSGFLKDMRKLPCIACGYKRSEIDHIKTRGSGGQDEWENCWPLCRRDHIMKGQIGLIRFVRIYPKLEFELIARGWVFDTYQRKWIRYKKVERG